MNFIILNYLNDKKCIHYNFIYSTVLIYAIYYLCKLEKSFVFYFSNVQNILTMFLSTLTFYLGVTNENFMKTCIKEIKLIFKRYIYLLIKKIYIFIQKKLSLLGQIFIVLMRLDAI